jgi:hypothetical protein
MPDLDRMASALAFDHRTVFKQGRNPCRVERCRHHHNAQVLTQSGLDIERQRQTEISLQSAFVELVEDHASYAFKIWGLQRHAGEHAFGDHFDAGVA